jgi:hypothetical protein
MMRLAKGRMSKCLAVTECTAKVILSELLLSRVVFRCSLNGDWMEGER